MIAEKTPVNEQLDPAKERLESKLEALHGEKSARVLAAVEARLAAGYSTRKMEVETGLKMADIRVFIEDESRINRRYVGWGGCDETEVDADLSLIDKLANWLAETGQDAATGSAETPTYKRILQWIENAHVRRDLIAITGDVGIGKSRAAVDYAAAHPRRHNTAGAVRIQFDKTHRKPAAALETIAEALSAASGKAYRTGKIMRDIGDLLSDGDLLIFDECNYLTESADIARDIHEKFGVGVVMIGNPDFDKTVWSKKGSFSALASRTTHFRFSHTEEEDVDAWLQWCGLTGSASLRRACVDIAARPGENGGLRTLGKIIDQCRAYFPDQPLTADLILAYAQLIGRGLPAKAA